MTAKPGAKPGRPTDDVFVFGRRLAVNVGLFEAVGELVPKRQMWQQHREARRRDTVRQDRDG